jgi:hypothetical protein
LKNLSTNLSIAFKLMAEVRTLKSKNVKKVYSEKDLIEKFCNHHMYKKLLDENPALYFGAISEKLDQGQSKEIIDLISKGNGDPEKIHQNMSTFPEKLLAQFNTAIEKAKSEMSPVQEIKEEEEEAVVEKKQEEFLPDRSFKDKVYEEKVRQEQSRFEELIKKIQNEDKKTQQ